jgi:predicted aminopeptidase
LHESAHATFFVRNQSTLCESVANFVGDRLAETYLEDTLGKDSEETRAYVRAKEEGLERARVMHAAFKELEALYDSRLSDADKLNRKKAILQELHDKLHFRRPIGNATLIQFRTYNSGQEDLAGLLDACGGDFPRFMRTLKTLEANPPATPQEHDLGKILRPLVEAKCPG